MNRQCNSKILVQKPIAVVSRLLLQFIHVVYSKLGWQEALDLQARGVVQLLQ
jgi:hypothetical protein